MIQTRETPQPGEARQDGSSWWPVWAVGAAVAAGAVVADTARAVPLPTLGLTERVPGFSGVDALVYAAIALTATATVIGARAAARRRAAPRSVLGRRLDFPWTQLRVGRQERLRNLHCIGPSGSGKTNAVLAPLLIQDLIAGVGVTIIEIKGGELCTTARAWAERLGRPVLEWEPGNPDSACWNPLQPATPAAVERLIQALHRTDRMDPAAGVDPASVDAAILRHAVAAFHSAGLAVDLARLREFLQDPAARQRVLGAANDRAPLAYFASVFDAWRPDERDRNLQGLLHRLDALLGQPFVRRALCPPPGAPEIDLPRNLEQGGILLVTLPFGGMLRQAEALGGFLLASLQAAVYARPTGGRAHFLYLDEFQRFAGPDFGEFLSLARGYNVGTVLAHQNLAQLREAGGQALQDAVHANARTTVLLRCDGQDAEAFASRLPPHHGRAWTATELACLPFGVGVAHTGSDRSRHRAHLVRLRRAPRGVM